MTPDRFCSGYNNHQEMKRIILFIVVLSAWTLTVPAAQAQKTDKKSVQVTGIEIMRLDNSVRISFSLLTGSAVTANNRSLVINPVLQNAGQQVYLSPIVVRGARASATDAREAMAADPENQVPFYTSNGKTLDYITTVPFENWMRGSQLVFNGVNVGGRTATEVNIGMVADNLLAGEQSLFAAYSEPQGIPTSPFAVPQQPQQAVPAPMPVQAPQMPAPIAQAGPSTTPWQTTSTPSYTQPSQVRTSLSIGDELAARFAFVQPAQEFQRALQATSVTSAENLFDYGMPLILGSATTPQSRQRNDVERFIEATRRGALSIQFQQGSKTVSRNLGDNNRALVDLVSAVLAIEASSNSRVSQVVIVGFSSPEGALNENERLAQERAAVAKDFLTNNTGIRPDLISIYNGSVDWTTLRKLVSESSMADKYKILDIIDNTPLWDSSKNRGRIGELMALNGGDPYRFMLQHFFPQLRQTGAYIKVYYENAR